MENQVWIATIFSVVSLIWNYIQSRKILSLQNDAERTNLIHKFQFEKEFKLHEELWASLVDLKWSALSLRPEMDSHDPSKTPQQIRDERMAQYSNAGKAVSDLFEKNKPFYPESIYKEVSNLLKITRFEAVKSSLRDYKDTDEYWNEAEKNAKSIVDSMEKVHRLVRARVSV